jgi:hypothetical protein
LKIATETSGIALTIGHTTSETTIADNLTVTGNINNVTPTEFGLLDGGTSVGSSITLADADGIIVNDGGTMKTIPASDISTYAGGGSTHASQWRLTTSFTGDTDPIASNLEETDAPAGFGVLGASMTQSSGVFTFPVTGYWWIAYKWQGWASSNFAAILPSIGTTTDNSTWAEACEAQINIVPPTGSYYAEGYFDYIFDVTNTSNDKVRFSVSASGANAYTGGSSGYHRTNFTFIRLGDT